MEQDLDFFYSSAFWSVVSIWFWAVIMPGADMFLVIRTAITSGKKCADFASLGIVIGTIIWLIVGFFFIHILTQTSFFEIVQILGGTYLIYMAWQIFLSLKLPSDFDSSHFSRNQTKASKSLLYGILTNLSNPKPPIFVSIILSKLPQTLPLNSSIALLCLMSLISLCWFVLVVRIFSIEQFFKIFMRFSKWIDGVVLTIFGAFGLSLVVEGISALWG